MFLFTLLAFGIGLFVDIGALLTAVIISLGIALHNRYWIAHCRHRIRTFIAENGSALEAAEKETWLQFPPKPLPKPKSLHNPAPDSTRQ